MCETFSENPTVEQPFWARQRGIDRKKRWGFLKMRRKGTDYSGKITKT